MSLFGDCEACAVKERWIADLRAEVEVLRSRLGLVLPKTPATQLQNAPFILPQNGPPVEREGQVIADAESPTPSRFQHKKAMKPAEAHAAIADSFQLPPPPAA